MGAMVQKTQKNRVRRVVAAHSAHATRTRSSHNLDDKLPLDLTSPERCHRLRQPLQAVHLVDKRPHTPVHPQLLQKDPVGRPRLVQHNPQLLSTLPLPPPLKHTPHRVCRHVPQRAADHRVRPCGRQTLQVLRRRPRPHRIVYEVVPRCPPCTCRRKVHPLVVQHHVRPRLPHRLRLLRGVHPRHLRGPVHPLQQLQQQQPRAAARPVHQHPLPRQARRHTRRCRPLPPQVVLQPLHRQRPRLRHRRRLLERQLVGLLGEARLRALHDSVLRKPAPRAAAEVAVHGVADGEAADAVDAAARRNDDAGHVAAEDRIHRAAQPRRQPVHKGLAPQEVPVPRVHGRGVHAQEKLACAHGGQRYVAQRQHAAGLLGGACAVDVVNDGLHSRRKRGCHCGWIGSRGGGEGVPNEVQIL
eukprot:Rhum_TRINITY_DN23819_c0_g1::Rhum_TRINITY_DN23819_c0_g1_i1::g.178799::m.178799